MERIDLKSMTFEELGAFLTSIGQPGYRSGQVFGWLYRGVRSFDGMTNIPKSLRDELGRISYISFPEIIMRQVSRDGTVKYLFRLSDGECIESVLMDYRHGTSLCISTQAGCRMGCAFCQSTVGGLSRNLAPSEMLDQVIFAASDAGRRIDSLVLMGIGEPLDNFENVIKFLRIVNDERGIGLGMRHISLSTSGIVEKIRELTEFGFPLTLSVSLHAAHDEKRNQIMPVNRQNGGVRALIAACRDHVAKTGRRISFEYIMIAGFNDTNRDANDLADLLSGMLCHVNLIPANPARDGKFQSSSPERVEIFRDLLQNKGIGATVRRTLGADIDAACGQLRARPAKSEA